MVPPGKKEYAKLTQRLPTIIRPKAPRFWQVVAGEEPIGTAAALGARQADDPALSRCRRHHPGGELLALTIKSARSLPARSGPDPSLMGAKRTHLGGAGMHHFEVLHALNRGKAAGSGHRA